VRKKEEADAFQKMAGSRLPAYRRGCWRILRSDARL